MLNTRKIALKNGGWVAATQNRFVWTTSFVHGGFQTMSMRQKKSLNVFSMECKWLKVRVTEEHLCLIITCTCISSDSRVRWSRQLPSRNTLPEQQEREQEWEQQESCWLRGIMDWIHPNLLRSGPHIAQMDLQIPMHRALKCTLKEPRVVQHQHGHPGTGLPAWTPVWSSRSDRLGQWGHKTSLEVSPFKNSVLWSCSYLLPLSKLASTRNNL